MSCNTGESNCDDCSLIRRQKIPCHPPSDPATSPGQSANPLKRKEEQKLLCVKCPTKKSNKFFTLMTYEEGTETLRGQWMPSHLFRSYNCLPQAKLGSGFFSSTMQPSEFTLLGEGSERRRESGRSTKTDLGRSLLSVPVSGCNISRRCYGKCGDGSKSPKSPSQPNCPEPKKMPVCPSPSKPPTQPCPPGKVKFRKCPPPPKLPKLPKCPPPCAPPPAPPVPKCPAIPKCPPPCPPPKNSPSSPPKKKCSGREMSTYGLIQRDYKYAAQDGIVFRQRCPVFLVSRRRFSSSSANFASKSKSDKNCDSNISKSYKESKETGKNSASKKSATDRCARSKSKKRDTKGARGCKKSKAAEKCSTDCAPKPRCPPPLPPPPSKPQVEWLPPICSNPKLVRPSPCPELSKQAEPGTPEPSKAKCPPPPPLPKPPCHPVCLCPCPPPPKLPPGSCPDVPSVDAPTESSCLPPCPPKALPPCPKDTWCPSKPICPSKK